MSDGGCVFPGVSKDNGACARTKAAVFIAEVEQRHLLAVDAEPALRLRIHHALHNLLGDVAVLGLKTVKGSGWAWCGASVAVEQGNAGW